MGLDIPLDIILAYALGLVLLYLAGWLLLVPLKLLFRFIINGIIGGVVLWLLNLIGGLIGISVLTRLPPLWWGFWEYRVWF